MKRPTDSAENTTNSAASSVADPVTTNTFHQPADAVAFSTMHASRPASCKSHNQNIQAARCVANGARPDRTGSSRRKQIGRHLLQLVLSHGRRRRAVLFAELSHAGAPAPNSSHVLPNASKELRDRRWRAGGAVQSERFSGRRHGVSFIGAARAERLLRPGGGVALRLVLHLRVQLRADEHDGR